MKACFMSPFAQPYSSGFGWSTVSMATETSKLGLGHPRHPVQDLMQPQVVSTNNGVHSPSLTLVSPCSFSSSSKSRSSGPGILPPSPHFHLNPSIGSSQYSALSHRVHY